MRLPILPLVLQHESQHIPQRRESLRVKAMMPALYQLFSRLRGSLGFMSALAKKLVGMKPRDNESVPQRMCPFCGLITPRGKVYCLECGKSFKPA
jgi:hypothetical protein